MPPRKRRTCFYSLVLFHDLLLVCSKCPPPTISVRTLGVAATCVLMDTDLSRQLSLTLAAVAAPAT